MERRGQRGLIAFLCLLLAGLLVVPAAGGAPPDPPGLDPFEEPLPAETADALSEGGHRNPKLDTKLDRLVQAYDTANGERATTKGIGIDTAGLLIENGEVLVEVRFNPAATEGIQRALEAGGMRLRHHNAPGLYEAWLPVQALEAAAGHPGVRFIRAARLVEPLEPAIGLYTSQGVAASNAHLWHERGEVGAGVTIALIDLYNEELIRTLQALGDWPPDGRLTMVDVDGGGFGNLRHPHGLATMEIAYDVAPGATFIAYEALTTGDWYEAIGLAAAAGADVISSSLGAPLDGVGDGSALPGSIAEAVGNARAAGTLYVNAAGNYRQVHWGGLFAPDADHPDSHDWGSGSHRNRSFLCQPNGYTINIDLFWGDWQNRDHDYDLYLLEYDDTDDGDPVWIERDVSDNRQSGPDGPPPQEWIGYTVQDALGGGGCPEGKGGFAIEVRRVSGEENKNLQVFAHFLGGPEFHVEGCSLTFPADSPDVFTVAAIHVATSIQESYSSEGPVLAPGGGLPMNTLAAGAGPQKPDAASFARVDTYSYGRGGFAGTSSAAPHAAGLAALVLGKYSSFTVDELEAGLIESASANDNDLGDPGHDNQYGWGRTRLIVPTAVTLYSFTAGRQAEGVMVEWMTAAESDNFGFDVYRAGSPEADPVKINGDLIAGKPPGSPIGGAYSYLDRTAGPVGTYYYWLDALSIWGGTTRHGPVAVVGYRQLLPMILRTP